MSEGRAHPLPVPATARLRLEPLEPRHAEGLHAALGDAEAMRHWDRPPNPDLDATRREVAASAAADPSHHGAWAVVREADGAVLGAVNYHDRWDWQRRASVGFILARAHHGRGYAREAVGALLGHLFGALALHRAEALVDPDNAASLALLARLGFRREGVMRERWWRGGAVRDEVALAILAPEWRARHPRYDAC